MIRQLLNRRYWKRFADKETGMGLWNHRCGCQRCSLHAGQCPFLENGERYKLKGSLPSAVYSFCSACALNHKDIALDRLWGKGHGAKRQWAWQQADFGEDGVFGRGAEATS